MQTTEELTSSSKMSAPWHFVTSSPLAAITVRMAAATAVAMAISLTLLDAVGRLYISHSASRYELQVWTAVGQVVCIVLLVGAGQLWRRGRRHVARLTAAAFLAAFVTLSLGTPLAGTKLYLFGISVDQQFRTEYLTRFTDSPALADMTYAGLPAFYSPGWFWIGGRAAQMAGMSGWEIFKPWAIISIAISVALAFILWSALIRFEYALLATASTTAVMLAYASPEPYSAMIIVLWPPVLLLAWTGLSPGHHIGNWDAVIGVGVFLGFVATFYTLLAGLGALTVTVMSVLHTVMRRSAQPLWRLAAIGGISIAIAATTWLPFFLQVVQQPVASAGSPWHYLPAQSAELSFPMLQPTLLGMVCMIGTIWLVVRTGSSARASALAIGVITSYAWSLLSMLATLGGTTLLSYRLQPVLTTLLVAAGALGSIEAGRAVIARARIEWRRRLLVVMVSVALTGGVAFVLDIPDVLRPELSVAYTDTDGDGQRADHQPAGVQQYYSQIDQRIVADTARPRNQTVVMTADYGFLAIYPYWGFQGLTPHYANPLSQFDARAKEIESWAYLTNSTQLVARLDALPWPAPTVFLMHRGTNNSYTLRLAKDVYPNQPNVMRYSITLDSALFSEPYFTVSDIGPFVLAIRKSAR